MSTTGNGRQDNVNKQCVLGPEPDPIWRNIKSQLGWRHTTLNFSANPLVVLAVTMLKKKPGYIVLLFLVWAGEVNKNESSSMEFGKKKFFGPQAS